MDTDRHTHTLELAEDLLADIELSRTPVAQQVLKAVRLARLIGDTEALTWLSFEMGGVPSETEEGRAHMTSTRRWINREKGECWWWPVSDIESSIETRRQQLEASKVESFSGNALIPVTRDHRTHQQNLANGIQTLEKIVNLVRAHLHKFAVSTYYELLFSERQRRLFENAREEIDRLLTPTVGDALEKIDSIYRRLDEGDPEAVSQAMNTCRRLIDSFADSVYPARNGTIEVAGTELQVGENHTRNRINAYVAENIDSTSRRKRLRRLLKDIHDRVNAAVHDDVSFAEARFLFLNTYVMLGEILTLGSDSLEVSTVDTD